jgi:hypothetical protein
MMVAATVSSQEPQFDVLRPFKAGWPLLLLTMAADGLSAAAAAVLTS